MERDRKRPATLVLIATGVILLIWSSVIHLHLWTDYYRHIATIGPLFIAQGISAIACAAALVIFRSAIVALLGAGLLAATAGGLLLSASTGLFNFHEHLGAPYAGMSLIVEFLGAAVLIVAAGLLATRRAHTS